MVIEHLKTNKAKIEYILKNYPSLRDSDKKLWISYLVMFHALKETLNSASDPYESFCDLYLSSGVPCTETIRRLRQKIQQDGKYLGTKRREKLAAAKAVKEWAIHN
jgi:hypothetical protein